MNIIDNNHKSITKKQRGYKMKITNKIFFIYLCYKSSDYSYYLTTGAGRLRRSGSADSTQPTLPYPVSHRDL